MGHLFYTNMYNRHIINPFQILLHIILGHSTLRKGGFNIVHEQETE